MTEVHQVSARDIYRDSILRSYPELRNSVYWREEDGDQIPSAVFIGRIRHDFPDLSWSRYRRVQDGSDHVIFLLDQRYAFRFTRGNELDDIVNLVRERHVVAALAPRLSLPIPLYTFVPDMPDYAGYELVPGSRLSPWRFRRLSRSARRRAAEELGSILTGIHTTSIPEMRRLGIAEESPIHGDELERFGELLERPIDGVDERIRATCTRWLGEIRSSGFAYEPVFVHSDFWHKHIYHDPSTGRLTGIIDWGDVCLMDPAKDFYGLWTYGESFVDDVLSHYGRHEPELRHRSLLHYKLIVLRCIAHAHASGGKGLRYGMQILNGNHHL